MEGGREEGEGFLIEVTHAALQTLLTFHLSKSLPRVREGFFMGETIDLMAVRLLAGVMGHRCPPRAPSRRECGACFTHGFWHSFYGPMQSG